MDTDGPRTKIYSLHRMDDYYIIFSLRDGKPAIPAFQPSLSKQLYRGNEAFEVDLLS